MNITTLDGVADKMTSLEKLDCSQNSISHLDISKNTKLIDLDCEKNALDYLDVTKNTELEILNCAGNNIAYLDLCNCVRLKKLNVANNKLGKLNLYSNPDLEELLCNDNNLSLLDMTANKYLSFVDFRNNANLSDVRQAGVDIEGVTWSIFNIGASSTQNYGVKMNFEQSESACPTGWRLPTKDECSSLTKHTVTVKSIHGKTCFAILDETIGSELVFPSRMHSYGYPYSACWTATESERDNTCAFYFSYTYYLNKSIILDVTYCGKEYSNEVRCVKKII